MHVQPFTERGRNATEVMHLILPLIL